MQRNAPEAAQRNFSWSQLKDLLAETTPQAPQESLQDFHQGRKLNGSAAVSGGPGGHGAHQLIDEAVSVVRQASEEAVRIRAEATEKLRRKQVEISELGRILKLTEQQLSTFELRHDEALRETQRYQNQIADLERTRAELDRQLENDKRIISSMERMLDDSKARMTAAEERARIAEESSKALELQLRTLVGTMRQKLLTAQEAAQSHAAASEPVHQPAPSPAPVSLVVPVPDPVTYPEEQRAAGRGLGAIAFAIGSAALATSIFLLNPTQEAKASDAAWLQGIWGATCDAPWLMVNETRVEYRTEAEGVLTGDLDGDSRQLRVWAVDGDPTIELEFTSRGENALVMRKSIAATGGEPEQSLLIRCSLVPAEPPHAA